MIYRIAVNNGLTGPDYLTREAVDSALETLLGAMPDRTTAAIWQMAPNGPVGVCVAQYEVRVDDRGVAYVLYR